MGRGEGSWPGWGEGLRGSRLRHASSDAGVLGMHAERQQGLSAHRSPGGICHSTCNGLPIGYGGSLAQQCHLPPRRRGTTLMNLQQSISIDSSFQLISRYQYFLTQKLEII